MLSTKLKKRFCKDFNIKIEVFEEPYFTDRLQLLGFQREYNDFETMIKESFLDDETAFLDYYDKIKENMISYIQESEIYKQMNQDKTLLCNSSENIPQGDIYKENYIFGNYISIDMKNANFNALVSYGKIKGTSFNNGEYSYKSFVNKFTDIDYFVKSKLLRQTVFGHCNPKRLQTIEKQIVLKLVSYLEASFPEIKEHILRINNDELIIAPDEKMIKNMSLLQNKVEEYSKDYIPFTFSYFRLGRAFGTDIYIKQEIRYDEYRGTFELKCNNPMETLFVTKTIKNIPITENDKVFKSEYGLAKILELPSIKICMTQKDCEEMLNQINDEIQIEKEKESYESEWGPEI